MHDVSYLVFWAQSTARSYIRAECIMFWVRFQHSKETICLLWKRLISLVVVERAPRHVTKVSIAVLLCCYTLACGSKSVVTLRVFRAEYIICDILTGWSCLGDWHSGDLYSTADIKETVFADIAVSRMSWSSRIRHISTLATIRWHGPFFRIFMRWDHQGNRGRKHSRWDVSLFFSLFFHSIVVDKVAEQWRKSMKTRKSYNIPTSTAVKHFVKKKKIQA